MSADHAESTRAGALAALRKRIVALAQKVAWGTTHVEKDGHESVVLTSDAAHAARVMADIEAIVRDVETMELPAP